MSDLNMADFEIKDYRKLTKGQKGAAIELIKSRLGEESSPMGDYDFLCILRKGKPIASVEYLFGEGRLMVGNIASVPSTEFLKLFGVTPGKKLFSIILAKARKRGIKNLYMHSVGKTGPKFNQRLIREKQIKKAGSGKFKILFQRAR